MHVPPLRSVDRRYRMYMLVLVDVDGVIRHESHLIPHSRALLLLFTGITFTIPLRTKHPPRARGLRRLLNTFLVFKQYRVI